MRIWILVILAVCVCSLLYSENNYIDFQFGSLIDERVFDFQTSFPQNPAYSTISLGYVYRFNAIFSLGCWVGAMRNVPPPLIGGIKLIFFDKTRTALSLNIGIVPTIGIYWNNFIFNFMLGMIENTMFYDPERDDFWEHTRIRPYIEVGYSLEIF